MASGESLASDGSKFHGLLPRKILDTHRILSWDEEMPACPRRLARRKPNAAYPRRWISPSASRREGGASRCDANQVQPAFAAGPPFSWVR